MKNSISIVKKFQKAYKNLQNEENNNLREERSEELSKALDAIKN